MLMSERLGLAALGRLNPESAHRTAILAMRTGMLPVGKPIVYDRLHVDLAGLMLPNPLGLAAGVDKHGEAIDPLLKVGFGFMEIGTVTPMPQAGNPKPRHFRLRQDAAAINRYGFNSHGSDIVAERLAARKAAGILGINIGPNPGSPNTVSDYTRVLEQCGRSVDFATINVSSPNTRGLRDLQSSERLEPLLCAVLEARNLLTNKPRVFVKVSPDLSESEIEELSGTVVKCRADGIIATNTTISRPGLASPKAKEGGGLSGRPLFDLSTRVLRQFYQATDGRIPLVGVGGIFTGEDAYAKVRAGAKALQVCTALSYGGLSIVGSILDELDRLLQRDGFERLSDAVGFDGGKAP